MHGYIRGAAFFIAAIAASLTTGCPPAQTPPSASFTASPRTGALPLSVSFTDTSNPGSEAITTWAWNFGDGGTSDRQNPTHVYTQPGVYDVRLSVTTPLGANETVSQAFITAYQGIPVILGNNAVLADEQPGYAITGVQTASLSGTTAPGGAPPQPGQVLVGGAGNGFARRVTGVTQSGNTFTASTENARLTEVFEQVDVTVSGKFSSQKISVPNVRALNESGMTANFNGSLTFAPEVTVDLRIENGAITAFSYEAAGRLNLEFDVDFSASSAGAAEDSVSLFEALGRNRPTVVASARAGGAPVLIQFVLDLNLVSEVTTAAGGNFEAGFDSERDIRIKAEYANGQWSSLDSVSLNPDVDTPSWNMTDDFEGRFYVEPTVTARLYGVDGPLLAAAPHGLFETMPEPAPLRASWKAVINARGEFGSEDLAPFGPGIASEYFPLTEGPTYPLWSFTAPQPILSVTPAEREVSAAAGTTTFTVSNTGTGSMPWTASRPSGVAWITGIALSPGGGGVTVTYAANTTGETRRANIIFTAEGAVGSPFAASVVQAAE